jgi:hypothetical protein
MNWLRYTRMGLLSGTRRAEKQYSSPRVEALRPLRSSGRRHAGQSAGTKSSNPIQRPHAHTLQFGSLRKGVH